MLHALRPAHVGDVNQTVDARLDLHERPEAREVAHLPADARPDGELERQHHPRILLGLFHTERDLLFVRIDLEHDRFDRLTDGNELRWMPHVPSPAHLADVHQPLDARLELDERAVVRDRDDLARDACADRVLLGNVLPGVALKLLEAERDALARPVDFQALDLSSAPMATSSEGCEMRPQDMSVMWSRPSTPPRSMNAPKSVMFFTTPLRT